MTTTVAAQTAHAQQTTDAQRPTDTRTDHLHTPRDLADQAALVLYATMSRLSRTDPRWAAAREEMIRAARPFAVRLAARYRNRGEHFDDLVQVAMVGLIKAVHGYDPEVGHFANYAGPTIVGEIKRHFRDKGWSIRVPRRLQDLRQDLSRASQHLTHELHRSPTVADLAAHLRLTQEEVVEGLASAQAYSTASLDAPVGGDDDSSDLGSLLGATDPALDNVDNHLTLPAVLASLPEREKRILTMRFYGNMTQSQIAEVIGVSQMHVSRLLSRALAQLRESMTADGPAQPTVRECTPEGDLPRISTVGRPGGVTAVVVVGEVDSDHAATLRTALRTLQPEVRPGPDDAPARPFAVNHA